MKRRDFLKNSAALASVASLPASITRAAATDTAYPLCESPLANRPFCSKACAEL